MAASLARASRKLGKALAPAKPAKLTFAIVRKTLAARNVTIRPNEWGEYRINMRGAPSDAAQFVSRSHDQQETLAEALAEGNTMADWHERAAKAEKAARVPCHAARLETAVTKRYRLGSDGLVHAPGVIAWAISGYWNQPDRAKLETLVSDGWKIPRFAAVALLARAVPYRVDGETVVFEVAY